MKLELKGIPVDVIHGIQEDAGLVPRIKDYAMHRNVLGVRAQINKRLKETLRSRVSSVAFKIFLAKTRKLAWH